VGSCAIQRLDLLAAPLERKAPVRRQVAFLVLRVDLDHDQVGPVSLTVGEAPRDPTVAAGDQGRDSRQGHPGRMDHVRVAGPDERDAIPDVRETQPQVHVVRQDGPGVGRVFAGDGPVVAARRRRPQRLPRRLASRHGAGDRTPGATQVEHVGPGDLAARRRPSGQRGIPDRTHRRQERGHLRRQQVVQQTERRLARRPVGLQAQVHGQDDQQTVLGRPGSRRLPQGEVLRRSRAERRESGVHTLGVGLEDAPTLVVEQLETLAGDISKAVQPCVAIRGQRQRAEQLRQLAGRTTPQQVHLKEAILRVQPAGRPGQIQPIGGSNRRHALGIAVDRRRRRQPGKRRLAVELRKAGTQLTPQPDPADGDDENRDAQQDRQRPADSSRPAAGFLLRLG